MKLLFEAQGTTLSRLQAEAKITREQSRCFENVLLGIFLSKEFNEVMEST
jgi:hypothetical protein